LFYAPVWPRGVGSTNLVIGTGTWSLEMSADPQPQKRITDDGELAEWREACAAVDDAYCEWLCASSDEQPEAFAAYRAALDQEEPVAADYGAVIERLRRGHPSRSEAAPESEELPVEQGQTLGVLIVDHDGFARRMLQRVLQDAGDVASVAVAQDGREALDLIRRSSPDVLLVEVGVPPSGGIELIRKVRAEVPRVRIVTVSAGADWDQAVLAAFRAGASGHIDKDTPRDRIARLVVLAAGGEAIVPPRLMTRVSASRRIAPPAADGRDAAPSAGHL
jgi:DNA-binding NarL/FixJ family response regulator